MFSSEERFRECNTSIPHCSAHCNLQVRASLCITSHLDNQSDPNQSILPIAVAFVSLYPPVDTTCSFDTALLLTAATDVCIVDLNVKFTVSGTGTTLPSGVLNIFTTRFEIPSCVVLLVFLLFFTSTQCKLTKRHNPEF
jgi:hypothetical protein